MLQRLASAPISWGVCEVPGWGVELPVGRVLSEMRELGLRATELGSVGYMPGDVDRLSALMSSHDLHLVGGFVPLVLHDAAEAEKSLHAAEDMARLLSGAGATEFITSMVATADWAPRFELSSAQWDHAAEMLEAIEELVNGYGMYQAIHPHVGTMIERRDDVREVLKRTDVGWCFDTGHLLIGGYDPLEFLDHAGDRIRHVHLKDTILEKALPVLRLEQSIMEGVQNGMFCTMGRGDVPIAEVVARLEQRGYDGWYVIEQDTAISGPTPEAGAGPKIDVQMSIEYLRGVDAALQRA